MEAEAKKNVEQANEAKKQIDGLSMQVMKDCEMITMIQAQEA